MWLFLLRLASRIGRRCVSENEISEGKSIELEELRDAAERMKAKTFSVKELELGLELSLNLKEAIGLAEWM